MSLEVTGKLLVKYDALQVSEKFKKREFVLDLTEEKNGYTFASFAKFQLTQDRCSTLDAYNEGELVKVSFNIKGSKWEKDGKVNYITNLEAWRVEKAVVGGFQPSQQAPQNYQQSAAPSMNQTSNFESTSGFYNPAPEGTDDLPF